MEITQEQLDKMIQDAANKAAEAAKEEYKGVLSKNEELLNELKPLKEAEKKRLESIKDEKDKELLKEGNIQGLVDRKTSELSDQVTAATKAREEAEKKLQAAEAARHQDKINLAITAEAAKQKVASSAIPDVVSRANGSFKLNDAGTPVLMDSEGKIQYAKDGITPVTPGTWLETLRKEAPHLWGTSTSSGATGPGGGENGAFSITASKARENPREYWALQEKAKKANAEVEILEG